jgi:hypothetical protein
VHLQPHHAQLRKKRNKSKQGASVAFLNWRFGLIQMTAWKIEVAPFPDLLNVASPTKVSSPSPPLYMDMGMVMMPK